MHAQSTQSDSERGAGHDADDHDNRSPKRTENSVRNVCASLGVVPATGWNVLGGEGETDAPEAGLGRVDADTHAVDAMAFGLRRWGQFLELAARDADGVSYSHGEGADERRGTRDHEDAVGNARRAVVRREKIWRRSRNRGRRLFFGS